jgi:group I intron endonuclease
MTEATPDNSSGVIYLIRCARSHFVYVGSTIRTSRRRQYHFQQLRKLRHHCGHLQHAFNKYGEDAFAFAVVERVADDAFLRAREQFWMWRFAGRLYNSAPEASGGSGGVMSDAQREALVARMRGNRFRRGIKRSPEEVAAREGLLDGNQNRKGKPHPAADKAKISEGLRRAYADGRRKKPAFVISAANLAANNRRMAIAKVSRVSVRVVRNVQPIRPPCLTGEAHPGAKLTQADVTAIQADTRKQRLIAAEYGISQSQISHIKTGKRWRVG